MLLVVVDAHSKWLNVAVVTSTTSSITIEKCSTFMVSQMLLALIMVESLPVTNLKHS